VKLTVEGCRARQQRLATVLKEKGLDGAIIARRDHVYYFTGFHHNRMHAAAAFINTAGKVALVGDGVTEEEVAVDELLPYEASRFATMTSQQCEDVAARLSAAIPPGAKLGADLGGGAACITALGGAGVTDLTRDIYRLRKCKDADEVAAIRAAIAITETMYTAAREAIRPGISEIDVFAHIRAEATRAAGEDIEFLGNDFCANADGGLPRQREMEAGELYILDAGPVHHGYFADNCRSFAVDGSPTAVQLKAWGRIDSLFARLEAAVRPGIKAVELYQIANAELEGNGYHGLVHHLGHGIGLGPHEAPELNPEYDATVEVGDVFTMEPGLYSDGLKAGIRLEENYLLTANGLEQLTSFPRAL